MSKESKEYAVKIAQESGAKEIEILKIRPYVKPQDYCFRVFECELEAVLKKLQDEGYLGKKCLFVTSPSALRAASSKFSNNDYYYACVTDTKADNLMRFVNECTDEGYAKTKEQMQALADSLQAEADVLQILYAMNERELHTDPMNLSQQLDELAGKIANSTDKYVLNQKIVSSDIDTVIALGGGVAMDAGQYLATHLGKQWKKELRFICIPTVLSVNAAFCYKAAMRIRDASGKYEVKYDSTLVQPDILLMDSSIILTAGDRNVDGAGDLISCLTASFDWKLNSLIARDYQPKGKDVSKPFNQEICTGTMELIGLLAERIEDLNAMREYAKLLTELGHTSPPNEEQLQVKKAAEAGLHFICEAYHWLAEQSWIMQHTMWESASEHGMFDTMEYVCGTEFNHGRIIGLCVYFMSLLQDNEHERAVSMIKRLKLDITLNNMAKDNSKVTPEKLVECLQTAKEYLTGESYRYTIISAKEMTDEWIYEAVKKYSEDFPKDPAGKANKDFTDVLRRLKGKISQERGG
ncbi:MAG: iron-containing alcohol dehydrogenase [Clostridia bacterium]